MYVTDLLGNTESLNHVQRTEISEEVSGAFTLALTSFFHANNPGHELIEEESIITVEGYDFRVKQLKESNGRKEVVALSTFFDLLHHRQDDIYGGTRTFSEFASFTLGGTGWTFEAPSMLMSAFIPNFGEDNVIKLINTLCDAFECEYQILPNKTVKFAKVIGGDNNFQFRYKHNIKALSKSIDTTNLRTAIKGVGADGLAVTYISDVADKYGVRWADPVENKDILTADEFDPILKHELRTQQLEVSFELDNVELLGLGIGETVWLIHEPMDLLIQTRVMKKFSTYRDGEMFTMSVVVGNFVPRTLQDITISQKVEIDENEKRTRSRFEQTNDRITLAVEEYTNGLINAYSKIELTAQEIRLEVAELGVQLEDGIANNNSLISQTATQIRSEVNQQITRVDGRIDTANSSITQTANQISSVVNYTLPALDGRVSSAESSITQQATQISQKVSQTDYNGNTIASLINQTSTTIDIQASKINLTGAVTVLSDISGKLGNITAGNIDIYESMKIGAGLYLRGPGTNVGIYFGSTQIMQDTTGYLNLGQNIRMGSFTEINGQLDLTRANVSWGNNKPQATWG